MARAQVRREREKAWLAILLAWTAGGVDAIGYLTLYHLFTSHMSGNSAAMGAHFGERDWLEAFRRGFAIPLFVLGVFLGALLTDTVTRRGGRSPLAMALGLELVLLLVFTTWGGQELRGGQLRTGSATLYYSLAGLPAIAMGIQNAALRRVRGMNVHTTYITGMLTHMAEEAVVYCYWFRDRTRGRSFRRLRLVIAVSLRQPNLNRVALCAGIWGAFVVGAILGGFAHLQWQLQGMAFPLLGLIVVILLDLAYPTGTERSKQKG